MVPEVVTTGLQMLANTKALADKLPLMPNIEMQTMGGKIWWTNLAEYNGWKVQQNKAFGNCRILDDNDRRRAWGSEAKILELFENIVNNGTVDQNNPCLSEDNEDGANSIEVKLTKLKQLYESGLIDESDYTEKKKEILSAL